jgi:stage III sporulation protein AE
MMVRRLCVCLLLFAIFFCVDSLAASSDGASIGENSIPHEIMEYLPNDFLDYSTEEFLEVFTFDTGINTLFAIVNDVFPDVLSAFFLLIGMCVISSVLSALKESVCSSSLKYVIEFASVLCISSAVFSYVKELFVDFADFSEQLSSFMTIMVPTMSALMISCGEITASAALGSVLAAAVGLLEVLCTYLLTPLISALICITVTSSVCGEVDISGLSKLIKNIIVYIMSATMIVLTSIMTFQTVIAKSADTAAVKGVKFVLGNAIPLVGGALADAMTTVASSIGMIRAATGIAGAIVICLIFALPVIKMMLWKLMFDAIGAVSSAFYLDKESTLFSEISQITGFLIAIMASIAMLFVVALTACAFSSGGK